MLLVAHLAQQPEALGAIPVQPIGFISSSANSGRAVASSWLKYVHIVLVKGLEGQGLHRNSVVRLSYLPNMTTAV